MKNILRKTMFIAGGMIAYSAALLPSYAGETTRPDAANVYFANISDGASVSSPVKVIFGLSGMGVAPAGIDKAKTGHHHIYLDRAPFGEGEDGKDEQDYNIPSDENHLHFGGGQTEAVLDLPSGKHTLQLVLGDKDHIPHKRPVISEVITIHVK